VDITIKDNAEDYQALKDAVALLESPSITVRLASALGTVVERGIDALPNSVTEQINGAVQAALSKAADAALWSLENTPNTPASTKLHKLYAFGSGAVGGAFGFAGLFAELPVSTTLMMRAVADVARSEGFDLSEDATKQACIEVFALGGPTESDDGAETGYYLARSFTTRAMQHLSKELAEIAATQGARAFGPSQAATWLAKLIEAVASRFGVTISAKFAAQAVPVIGGLTGGSINIMFTDFFQDMARGHFTVKRLESKYGFETVKSHYLEIKEGMPL